MGIRLSYGLSLPAAFVLAACAPLVVQLAPAARRAVVLAGLAVAVVGAVTAAIVQPFDSDHPQPITIRYHHDADAGESWWVVYARGDDLPPALVSAGGLIEGNHSPDPAPGWAERVWSGPAPVTGVYEPIALKHVERKQTPQGMDVVGRFVSPRGPRRITLTLPDADGFAGLWIDGALLMPRKLPDGSLRCRAVTVPPQGVRFRIIRRGETRLKVLVSGETPGLPREGLPLIDGRGPKAAPYNDADATIVSTTLRF